MIRRLIYRKCYVSGVHASCPKCERSYYEGIEIDKKEFKRRTEVYIKCKCGTKYKYHFGI